MDENKYNFLDLAKETLSMVKMYLRPAEIIANAKELKLLDKLTRKDKNPLNVLARDLRVNCKKEDTIFDKIEGPKYGLIEWDSKTKKDARIVAEEEIYKQEKKQRDKDNSQEEVMEKNERNLHCLLTDFVIYNENALFKCTKTKTIIHEKSKKGKQGIDKWLHPDMVGVYFPFAKGEFEPETTGVIKNLGKSAINIFSFELKWKIQVGTLREYYFQAISNSSWANEGYLVAPIYDFDSEGKLQTEMKLLNNAFGIGFIELGWKNVDDVRNSKILLPARYRPNIDWYTVNKLMKNPDFEKFMTDVANNQQQNKVSREYDEEDVYDEIYEYEKLEKHISKMIKPFVCEELLISEENKFKFA